MIQMKRIEDDMTEYPTIANPRMSVIEASGLMESYGIRHLPVVDNGIVIGVVSERDLKQAEILNEAMTLFVTDVMSPDPYCVIEGTKLSEVAREMAKRRYGSTVVLNRAGKVVGIFTTTDGMRVLSEILDSNEAPRAYLMSVEDLMDRGKFAHA